MYYKFCDINFYAFLFWFHQFKALFFTDSFIKYHSFEFRLNLSNEMKLKKFAPHFLY